MTLIRSLSILAATLAIARPALAQRAALAGCYHFEWADPRVSTALPDSIRLDTVAAPGWPTASGILQIHPADFRSGASSQWGYVGQAWWWQHGPDSLMLTYIRGTAHWLIGLHKSADSLAGVARFFQGDRATPPMVVRGIPILCVNTLSSLDSAYDAGFRCPESYSSAQDARSAVADFIHWATGQHPAWTIKDAMTFRVALLVNHNCWTTLEHMRAHPDSSGGA